MVDEHPEDPRLDEAQRGLGGDGPALEPAALKLARMHYNPNHSQRLGLGAPLWITICHETQEEPWGLVHAPSRWMHPHSSPEISVAQRGLHRTQGRASSTPPVVVA